MTTPRVSLIVRSMGRPQLASALASISAQTWPDIEVVLVAASGVSHPAPARWCGRFAVNYVAAAAPRSRPVAANAGLAACRGSLIGLLDDDDEIEPGHVEALATALNRNPGNVAAYSAARMVDAQGARVGDRALRWSHFQLFQDCYIFSNSVLFRREALASCRFDERLLICEDWDFWLQLAQLSDFVFVPAETAVVHTMEGTSGTGSGSNRDEALYREYCKVLARKWEEPGRRLAQHVEGLARLAREHFDARRLDAAERAAETTLAAYPHELDALSIKGTLLAMRGEFAAASRYFSTAVRVAPGDAAARQNLAQALDRSGRLPEALAEYDRLLTLVPDHRFALARRAAIQGMLARAP